MAELPTSRIYWDHPSESEADKIDVEFRLIYRGILLSDSGSGGRSKHKHDIRRCFHSQLKELWRTHPDLRPRASLKKIDGTGKTLLDWTADNYSRGPYRFVPLVDEKRGYCCSLSVLFLRRDGPGSLVKGGGDIDNRIKVLFDALRMPSGLDETGGSSPQEGEDPFFCLVSDDRLITGLKVTTDRLLLPEPESAGHPDQDVMLIVKVRVEIADQCLNFHSEVEQTLSSFN